jgi:hypothetical protein
MSKKIQLSIPKPCQEDWDAMTPVEKGKFCGSCQKQVVDFSTMSDRQLAAFFKKPSTGTVCGRFMTNQLDRDIEIPKKRIPWLKYFFTIALPAFFISLKSSASKTQGELKVKKAYTDTTRKHIYDDVKKMGMVARPQNIRPFTNEPVEKPVTKDTTPVCTKPLPDKPGMLALPGEVIVVAGGILVKRDIENIIGGTVVDDAGRPVPFASIETADKKITVAGKDGYFELKSKKGNKFKKIIVTAVGFQKKEYLIGDSIAANGKQIISLKADNTLPEVILNPGYVLGRIGKTSTMGSVSSVLLIDAKVTSLAKDEVDNIFSNNKIRVYPNPVSSGSALTIEWKETKEGYYRLQLIHSSGQLVHQNEIWIDTGARMLNLDMPPVAAGNYFLLLANKESGRKYAEKIVVQ